MAEISAMRAVFEYVAAHPGATGAEVWRDVDHGFFPCGREDVRVALRILSVMEGGLHYDEGRYYAAGDRTDG